MGLQNVNLYWWGTFKGEAVIAGFHCISFTFCVFLNVYIKRRSLVFDWQFWEIRIIFELSDNSFSISCGCLKSLQLNPGVYIIKSLLIPPGGRTHLYIGLVKTFLYKIQILDRTKQKNIHERCLFPPFDSPNNLYRPENCLFWRNKANTYKLRARLTDWLRMT